MKHRRAKHQAFYALIALIENEKEAKMLLQDLFTPQEIDTLAERWQLITQLAEGKSQRDIAENLDISISKITRGSTMLKHGSGGFGHFLMKCKKMKDAKIARKK